MENIYLGIDVGTGSVRVGAFGARGRLKGMGVHDIRIWRPEPDFVEQSSDDIWAAAGLAIRAALADGGVDSASVKGLSFDATCSLVALGNGFEPVTVSPTGLDRQNVIVWMDHRAVKEANDINNKGHEVLTYVGGAISPEMQPPKLMWLKAHIPATWKRARKFMDLADYMVYRASGNDRRSLCTTVCKWTYLGHDGCYDKTFFQQNGIDDLLDAGQIPELSYPMGQAAGELTPLAAKELGLKPGIAVGVGIIDAHAGGIGVLGALLDNDLPTGSVFDHAAALIGGTSSCHMVVSQAPRFIKGVWGPYFGAMLPEMWLNEGGQSATGALIDYVIKNNAAYPDLVKEAQSRGLDLYTCLNHILEKMIIQKGSELFDNRHVLPDHHGNRSPRADAEARGMVSGLNLNMTTEEAAIWYGATIQSIAYGTRHIFEEMNKQGYSIRQIYICGGHLKNERFIQEHADITGCRVVIPREPEAVLLGSAILGAVAAGDFGDIFDAMKSMCRSDHVVHPDRSTAAHHQARYEIFKDMAEFQKQMHQKMAHARAGNLR
jgi:FGGY-family pentulose kinase